MEQFNNACSVKGISSSVALAMFVGKVSDGYSKNVEDFMTEILSCLNEKQLNSLTTLVENMKPVISLNDLFGEFMNRFCKHIERKLNCRTNYEENDGMFFLDIFLQNKVKYVVWADSKIVRVDNRTTFKELPRTDILFTLLEKEFADFYEINFLLHTSESMTFSASEMRKNINRLIEKYSL